MSLLKLNSLGLSLVTITLALLCGCTSASAADGNDKSPHEIWFYRDIPANGEKDSRSDTERMFKPFGFMPAERSSQISVNEAAPVDAADPKKGTCMEFVFKFKQRPDWQGAYMLIDGSAWGSKPGVNVGKALGVADDFKLALRFRAKGKGVVTFKLGGITDGDHPSSVRFPIEANNSPTTLGATWREYAIGPIAAGNLSNLIDPLVVVSSGLDNTNNTVEVSVDDVRLEPFEKKRARAALPEGWQQKLSQTFWVCYTPTNYDPNSRPVKRPSEDDIRADLRAIRELADSADLRESRAGVITYGCKDGLDAIPAIAAEMKLSVILGVYSPRDQKEIRSAAGLLADDRLAPWITACCVGNEAITFRRATWDDIERAAEELRSARNVPMTTTEIIQSYGDTRLFKLDYTLANAHGIFRGITDPEAGAAWALERIKDLRAAAPEGHPVLMKELGWPSAPAPFTPAQQSTYWRAVLRSPTARAVNVCVFDSLSNVDWKKEMVELPGGNKVNVGPNWPVLFAADRKPKEFAGEMLRLWKETHEQQKGAKAKGV